MAAETAPLPLSSLISSPDFPPFFLLSFTSQISPLVYMSHPAPPPHSPSPLISLPAAGEGEASDVKPEGLCEVWALVSDGGWRILTSGRPLHKHFSKIRCPKRDCNKVERPLNAPFFCLSFSSVEDDLCACIELDQQFKTKVNWMWIQETNSFFPLFCIIS